MAKVTVVIPCYQAEAYLPQMLDSILAQTLSDWQAVLVDDGSQDSTGRICDEYARKDQRFAVIHKPNGGVAEARNDGLDAAEGEWVLFCDADDYLEPEALEKLTIAGAEVQADVVFGDVNLVEGTEVKPAIFYQNPFVTQDRQVIDRLIEANFYKYYCFDPPKGGAAFGYGGPWNKLVRRSMLLENRIRFDSRLRGIFDDLVYTAYIFAAARTVRYVHVPVYNYRQLDSSITHSFKAELPQINEAIFTVWQEFMDRYGEDGRFQKAYYANVLRRLKALIGMYFFHKKNGKSFRQQCKELKALMASEPYRTAFRELESDRLRYKYDNLLWRAARKGSALGVWGAYLLYRLKG